MRPFRNLVVALCCSSWLGSYAVAGTSASSSNLPSLSSITSSLPNLYPKQLVQDALDKEIRRMIVDLSAKANATENRDEEQEEDDELFKPSPRSRSLRNLVASEEQWAELNLILGSLTFNIPFVSFEQDILGLTVYAAVNGTCANVGVEDILLDWDKTVSADNQVELAYKIQLLGGRLKCFLEIDWNTGILDVSDHIKMKFVTNNNNFGVAVQLTGSPPTSSTFLGCKVRFNIGDIATSGGFSSDIINELNYLLIGVLRTEAGFISGSVCSLLDGFTDTIDTILVDVASLLEPLLIDFNDVDPLYLENNLPPDTPELVSFNEERGLGNVINVLLTNLEDILSAETINTVISSALLDEDGLLVIELTPQEEVQRWLQEQTDDATTVNFFTDEITDPIEVCLANATGSLTESLPFRRRARQLGQQFNTLVAGNNRRRLQFDDILANITIDDIIDTEDIFVVNELTPVKITVAGLDNFTDAEPFTIIGDYTLLTALSLDQISIEAEFYVDVLVNGIPIQRTVTAAAEARGVLINTTYLIGLDKAQVDTWTLGTFLNTNQTITCVIAALVEAGISQLELTIESLGTPLIEGFISESFDDLANTGVEAFVCAYQDLIAGAIPGFFQQNVTAILNDFLDCYISSNNATCTPFSLEEVFGDPALDEGDVDFDFRRRSLSQPKPKQEGRVRGYLDFRDLLLRPGEARKLGGSGTQPYGDLIALAYSTMVSALTEVDNTTGLPAANDFLPEEGLQLEDELFGAELDLSDVDIVNSLLQSVALSASDLRLTNLNTITAPLTFLAPTTSAHVLANIFNFGPVASRPLSALANVFTSLQGNNSGLAFTNEMEAGVTFGELDVVTDFLVMISTRDFIQFPIADILNINCWFALVQDPNQMVDGAMMENGFELKKFLMDIVEMQVKVACLNCTSELLPGAINILESVGAMEVLGDRIGPLIEEFATIDMIGPMIAATLGLGEAAARNCPHSPLYLTTSNETEAALNLELPALTNRSLDTVVYTAVLGAEIFLVLFSETHLDAAVPLSDPLSAQESFNSANDYNLLDWLRLNETFIPFAGDGLDFVKQFLGPDDDGLLGVNSLLGESFNLSLGLELNLIDGYLVVIDGVEVRGLDSFTQFDILETFTPQTMKNTIAMDNLTVVMDFSLDATNTSEPAQQYRVTFGLTDLNATVYLFTAIDMDKIEALELGQLLFVSNILSCFLASAYEVSVPAMRLSVGNLTEPVVEGLMPDTSAAAEASLQAIFEEYGWIMAEAMNSIFDSTIRTVVNKLLEDFIANNTASCLTSAELFPDSAEVPSGLIDLRDLLLAPEDSILLGGSGTQPYGDLVATGYSFLVDFLASDTVGEPLELNSFIDDFTFSQSGENGTFLFKDELVSLGVNNTSWIQQQILLSASDARVRNLNTLVGPLALALPTTNPYVIDNMINFGPIAGKPLTATLKALLDIAGELKSLQMYNMFDLNAALNEIDAVASVSVHILLQNLVKFPLRDILELSCWQALIQNPNATAFDDGASGLRIERLLTKLSSLSVGVECLECTNQVLEEVINLVDGLGASEVLGNRLGFLVEDIATSDAVVSLLGDFLPLGDEAGRSCPHHPLFNTSLADEEDLNDTLTLPALSRTSVDTILFAGIVFTEIAAVIGADNHLKTPSEPTDPLFHQQSLEVPEDAALLDWQNLEDVGVPFVAEVLDFLRSTVSDFTENEDGETVLGINGLIGGFVDETGTFEAPAGFSFELGGALLTINSVSAVGLDNFTAFDILNPIAPQTLQNKFHLPYVKLVVGVSIEILESSEPANNLTVTLELEGVNGTVPVFAAVDKYKLGNLTLGSLLWLNNALSCVVSTTYGVQIEEMLISVANISDPIFEGFLPDTGDMILKTTSAISNAYGTMIKEAIPHFFQDTLRILLNRFLASFEESDCKTYYPINATTHYVDFRQMFQPSNSTAYSPYGDLIPIARELLEAEILSINPETGMPKINDVIISPFTEDQSGIPGTLTLPGKIFDLGDSLSGFGAGNVTVEVFDARVENLDTIGEPLQFLEPNASRGDLIDNGATFGTKFDPLRFTVGGLLSISTPFGITSRDEISVFGELQQAPIFAVLLARLGAEEFLEFPLGHTADVNCWLGAFAAPALKEIQAGNLTVNPVASLHYLNIAFRSMRISAQCKDCSTRGLRVLPDLLEIMETTTTKNVLGYRNVELLLDLLNSDFVQAWILRIFQNSIHQCPYTAYSTLIDIFVPDADFPLFTDYQIETGVFTVTALSLLGTVILAETIAPLESLPDLIPDPVPDIPPGTRVVDFTELDTFPNGAFALTVIDGMNDFLGSESVDEETGEVSLGISDLLGNPIQPFDNYEITEAYDIGFGGLNIRLLATTISGLDTFTKFSIANITGPTTMSHELGWKRLQIDMQLEIDVTGTVDSEFFRFLQEVDEDSDGKYQFGLTVELLDIMGSVETFIALDYDALYELELGSFLRFDSILPCIQSSILHFEVTELEFEIGKVNKMQVSGFKSADTQAAAESLEETLVQKYGEVIASMAPNIFKAGRPVFNNLIYELLRESDAQCDRFPFDPSTEGFIDFRDLFLAPAEAKQYGGSGREQYGDIIHTLFGYSELVLRLFVLPLFENVEIPGDLFKQGIRFDVRSFMSVLVLRVSDLVISNVNSIGTLTYTAPVEGEPFRLNDELKFGIGRNPLGVRFRVFLAFKGLNEGQLSEVDIENDFEVVIDLKSLNLIFNLFLRVRELDFVRFPLRNILNLDCWFSTIPPPELDSQGFRLPGAETNLKFENMSATLDEILMEINCLSNCTSTGLLHWHELLQEPGASDDLTEIVQLVLDHVIEALNGGFLQDQIDSILVRAPRTCPHTLDSVDLDAPLLQFEPLNFEYSNDTVYLIYVLATMIPLAVGMAVAWFVSRLVRKRYKKWLRGLPSERVFLIQQKQEREEHMEVEMNEITRSMFESEQVHKIARYVVPAIVVINVGFFLSGHLDLAAVAKLDITIAEESFRLDNFYEFSIAQSTLDLWHSGGKALAALVLLFSGIWPYTKQLITLALWFLPPSIVSVSRRGQFLLWLDILAKWSMIDIIVVLITLAGFRIGGESPSFSWLPNQFWNMQIIIVPRWGLYANMIAQLMSQISSHFILMYHRRIIHYGKKVYWDRHHPRSKARQAAEGGVFVEQQDVAELLSPDLPEDEKKEGLCKHAFTRMHKPDGNQLVTRRVVNGALPIFGLLLALLLVFACNAPSLKLEAFGLIGILLELESKREQQAIREESIFSIAGILINQARYMGSIKDYIGLGFLAFLFVATLCVVPIVSIAVMVYLWLVPTTSKQKDKLAILLETLQAWQYVEVYMFAIVIESWQLGEISQLFINRYCENFQDTLRSMANYGFLEPRDAQCFELAASIVTGAYSLIPFVFGLAFIGPFVVKAYIQTLREKADKENEMSEEDKLRAFDRTTWDNRDGAIEAIRDAPVLFTDTYRWALVSKEGTSTKNDSPLNYIIGVEDNDKPIVTAPTLEGAETGSSDNKSDHIEADANSSLEDEPGDMETVPLTTPARKRYVEGEGDDC